MTKKVILCLTLVGLLAFGGQAVAEIGAIDVVPASTLLLPYFEVGLEDSGSSTTTLFSINNASAAPVLVHIVLWTDLSRATLDFDLYLTGWDVVTVNLRDLFTTGAVPVTGPLVPQGPLNTIVGDFSKLNVAFPGCDFPLPSNIPQSLLDYIRNLHTGFAAPPGFSNAGLCGGVNFGNATPGSGVARGYLTADVVNACSFAFPGNLGYFGDGGTGIASNANVIWGDYFIIDADPETGNFADGSPLVHIEATGSVDTGLPVANAGFWNIDDYTFYGRYVSALAIDNREPLATVWGTRYFNDVFPFDPSSIVCWRDNGLNDTGNFFPCTASSSNPASLPAPFPLGQTQIVVFNEFEDPIVPESFPFSPPPTLDAITPCPYEATRADVSSAFGTVFDSGWLYLNFNVSTGGYFDPYKQSYVEALHSAFGLFSVGVQGVAFDSALFNVFPAIGGGVATPKTFSVTTGPAAGATSATALPNDYCSAGLLLPWVIGDPTLCANP